MTIYNTWLISCMFWFFVGVIVGKLRQPSIDIAIKPSCADETKTIEFMGGDEPQPGDALGLGISRPEFLSACSVFVCLHSKFAAPFEVLEMKTPIAAIGDEDPGRYRILVSKIGTKKTTEKA